MHSDLPEQEQKGFEAGLSVLFSRLHACNGNFEKCLSDRHSCGFSVKNPVLDNSKFGGHTLAKHFGLGDEYADSRRYHDKSFINDQRAAIKERVEPPYWWRLEVGVNGNVHPYFVGAKDAFAIGGVWKDVYDLERLVRYLKKGIPYTPENLAVYLKAYVARKAKGVSRGPNHSGTVGVPNARTWQGSVAIDA